jgi:hypothetical protein
VAGSDLVVVACDMACDKSVEGAELVDMEWGILKSCVGKFYFCLWCFVRDVVAEATRRTRATGVSASSSRKAEVTCHRSPTQLCVRQAPVK